MLMPKSKYSPKVWDCNASHAKIPGECCDSNQSLHRFGEYLRQKHPKPLASANLRGVVRDDTAAGPLGFEPRLTDPESVVLPLH